MGLASSEMRVKMKTGCGVKIFLRDRICSYWQALCGLKIDDGMRGEITENQTLGREAETLTRVAQAGLS